MEVTITQKSTGNSATMVWRREGRNKAYNGTACQFLYNLPRTELADFIVELDGRDVTRAAYRAASAEMNAIRHGYRVPAMPKF